MLGPIIVFMSIQWARLQELRHDDRGMTTEAMIVTALLAVAAIAAVTVIGAAIGNKSQDISDRIEGTLGPLGSS